MYIFVEQGVLPKNQNCADRMRGPRTIAIPPTLPFYYKMALKV